MNAATRRLLSLYAFGLGCLCVGALMTEWVGSMLPIALGASASLMCTFNVVKMIRAKAPSNVDH